MSYTEDDLKALTTALAQGVKRVSYRDRTVEYRDLNEMLTLKNQMEVALKQRPTSIRHYPGTSKGL